MQALTLKDNAYTSNAAEQFGGGRVPPGKFNRLKGTLAPERVTPSFGYSRQAGSRSVSDTEHISSFRSATDVIDSLFKVEGSDVYRYVQRYPELVSLLLRSRAEAYWLFGPRARVVVRMEHDPEGEFEARLLVAIQTTLSAPLAIRLIDVLDDRWWLSVSPKARALMKIDVEYV